MTMVFRNAHVIVTANAVGTARVIRKNLDKRGHIELTVKGTCQAADSVKTGVGGCEGIAGSFIACEQKRREPVIGVTEGMTVTE